MTQNVVTTEAMQSVPVLQLITTEAPFQSIPNKALIAQLDNDTVVIDFQKPEVPVVKATKRGRQRFLARVYGYAMLLLLSASAIAAAYSLLTLQH